LASRLNFIDDTTKDELIDNCEEVSRVIYGLIKALR